MKPTTFILGNFYRDIHFVLDTLQAKNKGRSQEEQIIPDEPYVSYVLAEVVSKGFLSAQL